MSDSQSDQQPDRQLPIGVFDSGMGGLTVLSALAKAMPNEQFIYWAIALGYLTAPNPQTLWCATRAKPLKSWFVEGSKPWLLLVIPRLHPLLKCSLKTLRPCRFTVW